MTCPIPVKRRRLLCRLALAVVSICQGMSCFMLDWTAAVLCVQSPRKGTTCTDELPYQQCRELVACQSKDRYNKYAKLSRPGPHALQGTLTSNDQNRIMRYRTILLGGESMVLEHYTTLGLRGEHSESRHSRRTFRIRSTCHNDRTPGERPARRRRERHTRRPELQPEGHCSTERRTVLFFTLVMHV
jgi:hypothetical protein